ncbi:MAG: orotidine-5'-phosphate decarboxylase [Amaricoccus sp.]|uniref:orotidine-5'-phosphate decarboxylase n=1 Tax=Amaricoccus sp. TaxID=1872485 RepID=UPI0039E51451
MPDDRLIVGLDLPDAESAATLVDRLGPAVGFYKIGLGMLATGGLDLAARLKHEGRRVFLDMKLFDIGATVTAATKGLVGRIGPDFLTVQGDPHVVRAAVAGRGTAPTRILAITVLTSLDRGDLDDGLMVAGAVEALVIERARRAFAAGADGVVASPHEAAAIRALPEAAGKVIVTPGVRPAGAEAGDQKRIATPAAALRAGADHLVIGRPVWAAADPVAAARAILSEIAAAGA